MRRGTFLPMLNRMTVGSHAAHLDRMLSGLGVTPQMVDVDGVRTRLIDAGDGPPLVLLHGAIECGGALWAPVLRQLAGRHRVLIPDLPGLGESAPVDRLSVDRFRSWFADLLHVSGVVQPTVVAHSLSGSLSARAATQWNGIVRRLVVYAGPAIGAYRLPLRLRYVAVRFAIRPTARNAERFDRFALLDLDATRRRDPEWFHAFEAYNLSRARVPHVKETMGQLIKSETKPMAEADLSRIRIPISLLWGRRDRMIPLNIGETASARRGWPLYIVDDAAHVPHIEQPQSFVDVLREITTGGDA